jgi:hypothetical protein
MSFSSTFAGKKADLVAALAQDPHPNFQYGGDLGVLTQDFLARVAELVKDDYSVIVEASGHAAGRGELGHVSLTIRVVTVDHPVPKASQQADYVQELPDAATHHPDQAPAQPVTGTYAQGAPELMDNA